MYLGYLVLDVILLTACRNVQGKRILNSLFIIYICLYYGGIVVQSLKDVLQSRLNVMQDDEKSHKPRFI